MAQCLMSFTNLDNSAHLAIRYPLAFVEEVLSFYLRCSSKSLLFDKFNHIDLENAAISLSFHMGILTDEYPDWFFSPLKYF